MTTVPHIGMKVWQFDVNHRVYKRDANGKAIGGPIWREHWVPMVVVGETSRSWLVGPEWVIGKDENHIRQFAAKVAKKDWPGNYATSEADIDKAAAVNDRHRLADRVSNCRDYDKLKAIETILDGDRK